MSISSLIAKCGAGISWERGDSSGCCIKNTQNLLRTTLMGASAEAVFISFEVRARVIIPLISARKQLGIISICQENISQKGSQQFLANRSLRSAKISLAHVEMRSSKTLVLGRCFDTISVMPTCNESVLYICEGASLT